MADLKGAMSAPDGAAIQAGNVISVEMNDLSNELERELQHELEEVMAQRRKEEARLFSEDPVTSQIF
jgi:hypothetical protein